MEGLLNVVKVEAGEETVQEEGFSAAATLMVVDVVVGDVTAGLEKKEDGVKPEVIPLLALPHSASTSAMMSPPEMESKVRREEMSASRELRLVSPRTRGGLEVGEGAACSFVLHTVVS